MLEAGVYGRLSLPFAFAAGSEGEPASPEPVMNRGVGLDPGALLSASPSGVEGTPDAGSATLTGSLGPGAEAPAFFRCGNGRSKNTCLLD